MDEVNKVRYGCLDIEKLIDKGIHARWTRDASGEPRNDFTCTSYLRRLRVGNDEQWMIACPVSSTSCSRTPASITLRIAFDMTVRLEESKTLCDLPNEVSTASERMKALC